MVGVDFADDLLLVLAQAVEILELLVGHFERGHGDARASDPTRNRNLASRGLWEAFHACSTVHWGPGSAVRALRGRECAVWPGIRLRVRRTIFVGLRKLATRNGAPVRR